MKRALKVFLMLLASHGAAMSTPTPSVTPTPSMATPTMTPTPGMGTFYFDVPVVDCQFGPTWSTDGFTAQYWYSVDCLDSYVLVMNPTQAAFFRLNANYDSVTASQFAALTKSARP